MSKPKIYKKEENIKEEWIENLINISSTEVSEFQDDTKGNSHEKGEKEFLYYTPIKKPKLNYIPTMPKKPKRTYNYEGLVGRNLTIIFETFE